MVKPGVLTTQEEDTAPGNFQDTPSVSKAGNCAVVEGTVVGGVVAAGAGVVPAVVIVFVGVIVIVVVVIVGVAGWVAPPARSVWVRSPPRLHSAHSEIVLPAAAWIG